MVTLNKLALAVAVLIGTSTAYAQSPPALEQAQLAELSTDLRTQVHFRREPPVATR